MTINLTPITPRQWMIPSFAPDQLGAIVCQPPRGVAVLGPFHDPTLHEA